MSVCVAGIEESLIQALKECMQAALGLSEADAKAAAILESPKNEAHGDYSCTAALKLAKKLGKNPRQIGEAVAEALTQKLDGGALAGMVDKLAVEGPGFINVALSGKALSSVVSEILDKKESFGRGELRDEKVLLEFVSANPTGPLTIAHGRQAALGDSLHRILNFAGLPTESEYYNNDIGVQIETLGRSVLARCLEESGIECEFPENGYKGDYIKNIAKDILAREGDSWLKDEDAWKKCAETARSVIMDTIKQDLSDFGVSFETFFSQEKLEKSGKVSEALEDLKSKNGVYEDEGAVWLKSTEFGDDKDRVIVKSDGKFTYLMPDIAYHREKFTRGYKRLINILGPDHHGYIARLKASQALLGFDPGKIDVLIAQLVTLYEGDKQLKMSTRAGEFITLRQLIDEVGVDAARFFFILRNVESHLDFDLSLAKEQSSDNPVFYIQYAHARISSIREKATGLGLKPTEGIPEGLKEAEELRLLKQLRAFPKFVQYAATQLEPHVIADYLKQTSALFHQFYQQCRVADEDNPKLSADRLALIDAFQIVIRNGLHLLGVTAPDKM